MPNYTKIAKGFVCKHVRKRGTNQPMKPIEVCGVFPTTEFSYKTCHFVATLNPLCGVAPNWANETKPRVGKHFDSQREELFFSKPKKGSKTP